MKRIVTAFVAALATLGLLIAFNSGAADSATPKATTAVITITNFTYTGQLKVTPGQRVKVVNADSFSHTATNAHFDTGTIAPGTFKIFKAPMKVGKYGIRCNFHASMLGTLTVKSAAP